MSVSPSVGVARVAVRRTARSADAVELGVALAPNSDVLPSPSVAVAVIRSPVASPDAASTPEKRPPASAVRKPR